MNTSVTFALAFTAATMLVQAAEPKPALTANLTNRFTITGMSCDGCAKGIAAELKLKTGVVSANVSLSNSLAVVVSDTNQITAAQLIKVIQEAGYEAQLKK